MPDSAHHPVPQPADQVIGACTRAKRRKLRQRAPYYVRMLERADEGVGQILAALERRGLARKTARNFYEGQWRANGYPNAPLSNRKSTLWEGGIRVP